VAVDDVFRRLAGDVVRIILHTPPDERSWRRAIDRLLDRAFGLTQRAALVSELFGVIVTHSANAAERPFLRAAERVRSIITRRDPALWQRIVRRAPLVPDDPFLRVVADLERIDLYGRRITPRAVAEQRAARARSLDPQRRWVNGDRYRLSDRVWRQGQWVRRQIDDTLREGIRNGDSAVDIAKRLEQFLNPDKATTRYTQAGKIIRHNMTRRPYGTYGSSFARTLARTEVTRVHGQATIEAMKVTPGGLGVRWRLSAGHTDIDECDTNAHRHSEGMGPGEYRVTEVPRYPNHPNDVCTLVPVMASREDVVADIVRRYGA
jgi:hypothetical protein